MIANLVNSSEKVAQTTNIMLVVTMMSPMPTKGDTMPPNRNIIAPTDAEGKGGEAVVLMNDEGR